ncbi:hypothetical protein [Fibrivirga algicola]|uniref:Uncharacterized protein n=1 Tax=Fibrivirga algicola TaxID=2950420 RepID=A0ABX0QNL0_9BACT|nr:hypothetical protein [Fibrivirga algicola]ARK12413.1 hypothetical protein A6C57_19880 [Fibrella sp. ES10-3-2-2]NID12452.1 hypothetical protein [Fibrivirga algicola]
MGTTYYQQLNVENVPTSIFNKKLQAFALYYRWQRASNYLFVASQIVERNLTDSFIKFAVPSSDSKK